MQLVEVAFPPRTLELTGLLDAEDGGELAEREVHRIAFAAQAVPTHDESTRLVIQVDVGACTKARRLLGGSSAA
jgi:hypothetical protein